MSCMTPAWLEALLSSTEVTDICLNGPHEAFVDRGEGLEPLFEGKPLWSEEEMRKWVLDQLTAVGKSWDARHPFIDATLCAGHRLHVAFPPLARQGILVSLRRPALVASGSEPAEGPHPRWKDSPLFPLLREAVQRGDSVLISGATGSGKTTLASDLLSYVPRRERILALEDTSELRPCHPHFISLVSRPPNADGYGEVTLRALLKQVLRMRPDRIVLGECRGPEVLDLLQALNTGHHGALATLHANSPRDALRRIELLCLLAGNGALPSMAIRELLGVGVQWIAQVQRNGPVRRISELWRIEGREGDTILMRPMVQY
ncbi:MAG: Flp pilus assembly complex ATPase component TadA [Oligoflexia bacterium]|nr:Flp pilus assembly complex ATPase component TadA [Oligoflexia bacterium]